MTTVATNRKARHDFHILESIEAGIELRGTEVKSLREKRVNLQDSFARFEGQELFVYNMHISPYAQGNRYNVDPIRVRKLLLHRKELKRLIGQTSQRGHTLIPLKIYFKGGFAKVEIALAKGKQLFDKREELQHKETQREINRVMKQKNR